MKTCTRHLFAGKFNFRKLLLILLTSLTLVTVTSRRDQFTKYITANPSIQEEQIVSSNQSNQQVAQEEMNDRMKQRIKHMKNVCSQHGLDRPGEDHLHKPDPWEYIVNREHKLIWCNIFKSSSTSWMYVFNILAGYSPSFLQKTRKVPLQMARDKYGRPKLEDLQSLLRDNESVSFLVARNPFERLVSGYRDKIQNSYPRSVHDKLRREITFRYRGIKMPSSSSTLSKNLIPTFTEFVAFIVQEHERGKDLDMHWTPVYSFCTPCQFELSNIVLYQTQAEDTKYILEKAGIYDKIGGVMSLNPSKGASSTQNTTAYYVAQLPEQLFDKLVALYRLDFELFGFELPEFRSYETVRESLGNTEAMPTTIRTTGRG